MALSSGHIISCADRNRRGGIKTIYLGEVANIDTANVTAGASQEYTAFPLTAANYIYKFEFDRETAGFTANATRENGSTVVDVELTFTIPKITKTIQASLESLKETCGLFAVCETFADDGAGATYEFILGFDQVFTTEAFLDFGSGEQNTGAALQDANATVITLVGKMGEYPREYVPSGAGIAVNNAATNEYSIT